MRKIMVVTLALMITGCADIRMKPGWREMHIEGTRVWVDPVNPPEYTAYNGAVPGGPEDVFGQQRRQIKAVEEYTGCKVVKYMYPPDRNGARLLHAIVDCDQRPEVQ